MTYLKMAEEYNSQEEDVSLKYFKLKFLKKMLI